MENGESCNARCAYSESSFDEFPGEFIVAILGKFLYVNC